MAALCVAPNCGAKKSAPVHSKHHPAHHPYLDPTKAGLQPISEGKRAYEASAEHKAVYARAAEDVVCMAEAAGAPDRCHGPLTPHHTAPRGTHGGQEAAERVAPVVTLCAHHNEAMQTTLRDWALSHSFVREGVEHPFLVSTKGVRS